MDNDLNKQLHFRKARKRVKQIKDFYMRLGVYCAVNAILLTVWIFNPYIATNFWIPTCFFTTVVAGFLIVANAINLYGGKYMLPEKWEERKLEEFRDKQNQSTIKYE